ncbi:MAG: hypothetical protein P8X82_11845, partial [Gemmatimonadales bacterium]
FDALAPCRGEVARRVARALAKRMPFHLRCGIIERMPAPSRLEPMVRDLEAGAVRLEATERIVDAILRSPDTSPASVLDRYRSRPGDATELEQALETMVEAVSVMRRRPPATLMRWAMGEIVPQFLGRLDPKFVEQRVTESLAHIVQERTT